MFSRTGWNLPSTCAGVQNDVSSQATASSKLLDHLSSDRIASLHVCAKVTKRCRQAAREAAGVPCTPSTLSRKYGVCQTRVIRPKGLPRIPPHPASNTQHIEIYGKHIIQTLNYVIILNCTPCEAQTLNSKFCEALLELFPYEDMQGAQSQAVRRTLRASSSTNLKRAAAQCAKST